MKTVAFKQLLLVLAAATVGSSAFADSTWQMWDNTSPVACAGSGGAAMGNSFGCSGSAAGDPTMTVTAWSTTGTNGTLQNASIQRWGWAVPSNTPVIGQSTAYDYGVVNQTGGQNSKGGATNGVEDSNGGQHSMDNSGATDLMLLNFTKATALTSISLGWTQTDADISVLRYTGTSAPVLTGGKTIGDLLLSNSWELVGHYADLQNDTQAPIKTANITNAGSSSWWIVSAYNANYGAGTNANGGSTALGDAKKSVVGLTAGDDYVKLLQVAGKVDTSNKTPEPGSLALMGVAMVGVMASRRRKSQKA